jgi:hypothetical protein
MSLNNLTPAKGSVKKERRIARGQGSDMEEPQLVVIKEPNQDLDIKQKSVSKEVKCLCKDVFLNSDLKILIALNIKR